MRELWSKQRTADYVGLHPESLMRLVRESKFPAPIKIGQGPRGRVRFVSTDVANWLDGKLSERA